MKCQQYPLGKNMQIVVLVADQLVFHRTQVRFQQRKIQVTCTFRKVVGFHGDATELLGFHLSNYTSNSYPWPPLWNSTLVLLQGARQSGQSVVMMALCACNPPVVFAKKVALCNAHLWADPGRVIDGHRHSTENRTAELWWPGGIPKALSGVMPPLKSCATSPDSWRPALTSNNNQDRTLLHTAVAEWLTCFIELHRLHGSPKSWVCLALSARSFGWHVSWQAQMHRLYHLRLPCHMPTKGPWAHDDSTCCVCCGTGDLKTPGLIGLDPNRLLVIRIGS